MSILVQCSEHVRNVLGTGGAYCKLSIYVYIYSTDLMRLSGLAFVFTGELESFSRDEATDLVKCFGG